MKTKRKFTKMQGLGNDFVVFDCTRDKLELNAEQAKSIADRHFGVGCDQILLVEAPVKSGTDFRYRIFNADGGEVEQCGNGARCFVRFVHDRGMTNKNEIRVDTLGGVIVPKLEADGEVSVDMGVPEFAPARVPFVSDSDELVQSLDVAGNKREISVVSMGNPHAVQVVDNIGAAPLATEGPLIERHPRFPQRVNAGYMQVLDRHRISLRVFERGAGETLACGTGACAAVAVGIRRGMVESPVWVVTRGGELTIEWQGPGMPVRMKGAAESVFEGEIEI
jgi:diaminopimelate epimerase